ncbi:M14 family metallopeptidase [Evansella tamaricis]|uniref:LysM peptidoglycan-binding domain-containing protein n=1 Tax=Evansella tamaricis TaxID=2069301 RepID=A0ABS6JKT5_9BACI|nr:M14 family metallopeptidase [Evansella tamaricis]MBU9714282.1 LysM peptidoglycan-binding domain-containing protein [Evansella tamaricis]
MRQYKVKEEDTLHKVAFNHHIYVKDILDYNPKIQGEHAYIQPGDDLIIPTGFMGERVERPGECVKEFSLEDVQKYIIQWDGNVQGVSVIGNSVLGKPIYLIKIGEGKKEVFYSGGWHANEWMTSKFLCDWVDQLVESSVHNTLFYGENVRDLLQEVTLYIVPMVNPDGITLVQQGNYPAHPYYDFINKTNKDSPSFDHWSANIRGVDLNHQWPAGWKKEADESPQQPWPRHYSGTGPLTEPEAQAVYTLTMSRKFSHVLAFHSQGQLIYWGYRNLEPESSKEMVHRLSYKSSYVPIRTADSDGGYKDWFIQETGRPGFTIEVGVGTNPLPFRAYGEIWSNNVLLALEGLKI